MADEAAARIHFKMDRILDPCAIEINPDNPSTQFNASEQSTAGGRMRGGRPGGVPLGGNRRGARPGARRAAGASPTRTEAAARQR
jgi:hypothetical protein